VKIYVNFAAWQKYCKEKDIEICAAKLHLPAYEICVIAIYRAASGNLQQFFRNLDEILNMISGHTEDIVICEGININYSSDLSQTTVGLIAGLIWPI
jgi:hypothetical protein